jgi:hypothetical protein
MNYNLGNPNIALFKAVYKRYTSFSINSIESSNKINLLTNTKSNKYDITDCINGSIQLSDYTCCICFYLLNEPMLLQCNHTICYTCLKSINNKLCPLCRKEISNFIINQSIKNIMNNVHVNCQHCNSVHSITTKCIL